MTFAEHRDRMVQIVPHLRLGHLRDRDAAPGKIVEEPARIGAVVPGHHRAVSLAGQYGSEFGDQFAIGIRQ